MLCNGYKNDCRIIISAERDSDMADLGLYIHIPFCEKKCDYCDFLSAPADRETKEAYVKALIAEIHSYKTVAAEYLVRTVFIGGGTPSSIDGKYIYDILDAVKEVFAITGVNTSAGTDGVISEGKVNAEITIEVNPGTVSREKLDYYRMSGINRLSFGLQSADDRELKLLGRIHTYEDFVRNYRLAREMGFYNINIDLMSALPGQTMSGWMNTLCAAAALKPEHISAYSLIIEEGTPFHLRYREEDQDEELDREIYAGTKEYLERYGYKRYEISNYAKPGFECRHNSSYWRRTEYLGIGLGSSSLLRNQRYRNEDRLKDYIRLSGDYHNIRRDIKQLAVREQMEEFMFLGLRMSSGISKEEFKQQFGSSMDMIYGDAIRRSVREGLLHMNENQLYLTDKGIDLSNMVFTRFLLDD